MPYKVFPENGKSAVYAVDAAGKKVGKRRGLHDSPKDAQAQIAAIMANEKPKKEADISEVWTKEGKLYVGPNITQHYLNESQTTGQGFYELLHEHYPGAIVADQDMLPEDLRTKDYYDGEMPVMMYASGPLTFADLQAEEAAQEAAHEMHELTYSFQRLASNIMASSEVEDKAAALSALASEYAGLVGEKAKLEVDKAVKDKAIAQQIAGDNQPGKEEKGVGVSGLGFEGDPTPETPNPALFIWKEADTYRWLAAYSNNRRDDDNPPEIISSQSHKEFDEALNKGEWPMPELWVWHVPIPVGQTLFHAYDEAKGFPIAGGVFNKGFEWVAEGLAEAGWDGVSHGMPSEWIQRDKEDPTVIIRHRTKEVSILPNWAAANKLAFTIISKENDMADATKDLPQHKRDELVAAFGEDKAKLFEAALADKAKAADEAQIEQKETTGEKAPTTADVVKGLEFIVEQLNALNDRVEARFKALEEATVKEEDQFDIVAKLRAKSVIGNEAARIDGRSALAKDAPKETQPETPTAAATGVPIGLVDGLFQLNQGWYNRGGEQR